MFEENFEEVARLIQADKPVGPALDRLIASIADLNDFVRFADLLTKNLDILIGDDGIADSRDYIWEFAQAVKSQASRQNPLLPTMKSDFAKVAWALYISLCVT